MFVRIFMADLGISLQSSLYSVGISQAKGVDLVMARDQLNGTLPTPDQETATNRDQTQRTTAATATDKKGQLTTAEQREVAVLQAIDSAVRAHEQAHIAAGRGVVTSGPNYTYTYGPDGKSYATGGEVGIDTSAEKKPEANIDKGARIQAAALAPKDPSPQDYRVASIGSQLEARGRADLARERIEATSPAAAAETTRQVELAYGPPREESGGLNLFA